MKFDNYKKDCKKKNFQAIVVNGLYFKLSYSNEFILCYIYGIVTEVLVRRNCKNDN